MARMTKTALTTSEIRMSRKLCPILFGSAAFAIAALLPAHVASAQEVVQPLPPAGTSDLNAALRRLARNSRDLDALIDAGNAALKLGDIEAAIGFFGRADELSPGNPRVKVGLAGAFVRSERPLEALRLFDEAEAAGASTLALAAERGLAYDLVGDGPNAQAQYRRALAAREDAETRRRLALSLAISGDRQGFEQTIRPLLDQGDRAAHRTRAFGLAVLESEDEAVTIASQVMPPAMAERIAPYLRYMPQLTKAQQAAAANLGIFPKAARIGRDDPRIASYAGSAAARNADRNLAPAGAPLGPREDTRSGRRRPGRADSAVDRNASATNSLPRRVAQAELPAKSPPAPAPRGTVPTDSGQAPAKPAARETAARPSISVARTGQQPPAQPPAGFDLAQVAGQPASVSSPVVQPAPAPIAEEEPPASVAEAFAAFGNIGPAPAKPSANAVDITSIKPPREKEEPPPPPEPPKPKHPSRIWVQVATGKDVSALEFDWRRFTREAPELLKGRSAFVTPWGQSNRLLTGPFASARAARDMVNALKEGGLDSFTFTSPEGQEITPLG